MMVKTEATSKRKAEDEEAKPTLVKVAGCPSMSVLGLTAATGWGGVCYVPFSTPTHAAAAVERINREVAGAVASVVDMIVTVILRVITVMVITGNYW